MLLPAAVVLMILGASYRVTTFWWDNGFTHHAYRAEPGQKLSVVNSFSDAVGETTRTYTVRAVGIERSPTYRDSSGEDQPVPDGAAAYRVTLEFTAAPDQDLNDCLVGLVDRGGQLYGGRPFDPVTPINGCVPEDHPGPQTPIISGARRGVVEPGQDRPATWTVRPIVVTSASADLVAVWIGFSWPDYITLALPQR